MGPHATLDVATPETKDYMNDKKLQRNSMDGHAWKLLIYVYRFLSSGPSD